MTSVATFNELHFRSGCRWRDDFRFSSFLFRRWSSNWSFVFWFHDRHVIRQWFLRSGLSSWIPRQHDFHLDTDHTLSQVNVTNCHIDVFESWVTTVDHEAICELHPFGSLSSKFSRYNNFATFGTTLHDETNNTITCFSNWCTSKKLVSKRFTLSNRTQTSERNLLCVQLNCAVREIESFLHNRCQFSDSSSLLTKNILGSRGENDNFRPQWCDSYFYSTVTIFSKFSLQELVQFCLEDTIGNKLSFLADLSCHFQWSAVTITCLNISDYM